MGARPPSFLTKGSLAGAADIALRLLLIGAAAYAGLVVLVRLRVVVVPLLIALLLTALLSPAARWLEHRGLPTPAAASLTLAGFVALLAGVVALVTVMVTGQIDELRAAIVEGWRRVQDFLQDAPIAVPEDDIGSVLAQLGEQLSTAGLVSGFVTAIEVAAGLLLTLFFTFFLVKDGPALFEQFVAQFRDRRRTFLEGLGSEMWNVVSGYMRGLTAVAFFNSLLKGLALVAIGVPLVLPLMLITFVGSYIPFAGPIVAGTVAALVALAEGGVVDALLIMAAAIVIQQIEGNVLQPVVYGRSLNLHAIVIVASVVGGAVLAGIVGALLAVPVVAIAVTVFTYVRDQAENEEGQLDAG